MAPDPDDEQDLDEDPDVEGQVRRRRAGRVAFGHIRALTVRGHLPDQLREALKPGQSVQHYQRTWILGQTTESDGVIFGRLGFERASSGTRFDRETRDFVTERRADGTYSVFGIAVAEMRVAFQTHGQTIKPQSFVGALQALLNESSPTERWRVEREYTPQTWQTWLADVERIDKIKVRVRRPNPDYQGRSKVEGLLEGLNAEVAELQAKADADDPQGIDPRDDLLTQLIGHAESYGAVDARGEDAAGRPLQLNTERHVNEAEVEVDPETGEVRQDDLRRHLAPPEDAQRSGEEGAESE